MALRTTKLLVFDLLCQLIKWAFDSMVVYFNWVSRLPTEINKVTCHYRYVKSLKVLFGKPNQEVHNHTLTSAAVAKSLQSCPTLCDPTDGSPPGSAIPEILQARTLEWAAISFSNAWKWKVKVKSLSRIQLFAPHGLQPTRLLCRWDFPGKSTGVGCHRLLPHPHYWETKIRAMNHYRAECGCSRCIPSYI